MGWFADPSSDAVILARRVFLSPPRKGDYLSWAQLRDESRDFLVPFEPRWPADALSHSHYRRHLKRMEQERRADRGYAFHVFRQQDCQLLGAIALSNLRRGVVQSGSIGYWIAQPYARQGYMTEALSALMRHAFHEISLHRLEAACLPRNTASQNLLRKCAFQPEGLARRYLRINGAWEDHLLFASLIEDWVEKSDIPCEGKTLVDPK